MYVRLAFNVKDMKGRTRTATFTLSPMLKTCFLT